MITIPNWSQIEAKVKTGIPITPLESFIYETEPAGSEDKKWRQQLQKLVAFVENETVVRVWRKLS